MTAKGMTFFTLKNLVSSILMSIFYFYFYFKKEKETKEIEVELTKKKLILLNKENINQLYNDNWFVIATYDIENVYANKKSLSILCSTFDTAIIIFDSSLFSAQVFSLLKVKRFIDYFIVQKGIVNHPERKEKLELTRKIDIFDVLNVFYNYLTYRLKKYTESLEKEEVFEILNYLHIILSH